MNRRTTRAKFPTRIEQRRERAAERAEDRANRSDAEQLKRLPDDCREAKRLRARMA